jgi:hypothetical protein
LFDHEVCADIKDDQRPGIGTDGDARRVAAIAQGRRTARGDGAPCSVNVTCIVPLSFFLACRITLLRYAAAQKTVFCESVTGKSETAALGCRRRSFRRLAVMGAIRRVIKKKWREYLSVLKKI